MMRGAFSWLIGLALAAQAQFETELAPREVEPEVESGLPFQAAAAAGSAEGGELLMPRLDRLRLRGAGDDAGGRSASETPAVECLGLTIDNQDELAQSLAGFLGRPLTTGGLDAVIVRILRHYESNDRPVVEVWAPQQSLADGLLTLEVIEGTIGAVGIETAGVFNDELLGSAIRLDHGGLLRASELQAHLDWYNRNPFRPVALYAAPGIGQGEADLVFSFSERRPWRFYGGYENTGAEVAGENRYFAGVNWGNALGKDHVINYSSRWATRSASCRPIRWCGRSRSTRGTTSCVCAGRGPTSRAPTSAWEPPCSPTERTGC